MRKIAVAFICILLCLAFCACSVSDITGHFNRSETQKAEGNGEIKKYFYNTGALSVFRPDENYISVVPYLCGSQFVVSENGEFVSEPVYGFATADGKIITDGAYRDIYTETSTDGRMFYVCEMLTDDKSGRHFQLVPSSGAGIIEFSIPEGSRNKVVNFDSIPCECIAVPDRDSGITLYDFNAKPIVNLTKVFGADCFFRVFYCDGEKIIFNVSEDAESEAIGDNYFCINKKGKLLYTLDFGGDAIQSFQGGYFIIGDKKGNKRLSDVLGNIITPKKKSYTDIVYDRLNKNFWCCNQKKKTLEKTDSSGKVVFSKSIKSFKNPVWSLLTSPLVSSILVREQDNAGKFLWFNVKDGKKIKLDINYLDYFGDVSDEKYDYIAAYYDNAADLYDSSGTFIKTVENIENYYGIYNGKIAYRDTDGRLCIKGLRAPFDLKIPLDKERADKAWISDFSEDIIVFSYYEEEGRTPKYTVYNLNSQQMLDESIKEYRSFETKNGRCYSGILDGKYVLKNTDGKALISISE